MRYLPSFFDLAKLWVADRIGLRRLFSATSYLLVRQLNADTLPEGPEGNRHLQDSFLKLFRTLQPDIFLDIGANDGSASLTVRRVAPTCQIHAFEANPRIYEKNREKVKKALLKLDEAGIAYCFFVHSAEALEHSKKIGLINI